MTAASCQKLFRAARIVCVLALLCASIALSGCSTLDELHKQMDVAASLQQVDRELTLGNVAQARTWADRAIALDPQSPATYIGPSYQDSPGLIEILQQHGDYPDIVRYLTAATAKAPLSSNWQMLASLADAQEHMDDTAGDVQASRAEIAAIDSQLTKPGATIDTVQSANLLTAKADAEWNAGERAPALADYRRAIETYPNQAAVAENDEAYNEAVAGVDLPQALSLAKQAVAAARHADDEITLAEFLDTRGWVEHRMGDDIAAVNDLEQAATAMPAEGDIAFHLASVYRSLGRTGDAVAEFQRAIALNPYNADARQALQALAKPADTKPAPGKQA